MYVVIFRAKIRGLDEDYSVTADRMRELAFEAFGCLDFQSVTEGSSEVTLSYWPSEEAIHAWRMHPEHVAAQKLGRERWYESYSVEIAQVSRSYRGPASRS